MRHTRQGFLCFCLGLLATLTVARADDLTTTTGKKATGKLVAVDPKGVILQVGEGKVQFPTQDLHEVDLKNKVAPPPPGVKYAEVELTDGSVIRCAKVLLKGKTFELELLPGPAGVAPPTFQVPMGAVFTIMRGAEDEKNRDPWRKMLVTRGKRDLYVIRQADRLDFVPGTILGGSDTGTTITFEREGGEKTELVLARATGGLVFNQVQPAEVPPLVCRVVDVFGNTWAAKSVELTGPGMTLTTVSGVTVTIPALSAVAKLDYSQGNITYLSDMSPQIASPAFPEDEPLRATVLSNKGLSAEPLKLGNQTVRRGVWVRAPFDEVVLTYELGGDFKEFKAMVGIPAPANAANTAKRAGIKLTVEADGRVLFSDTIKPNENPRSISVDVKGSKQLRLTVEQSTIYEPGGTYLILGDARVQK